MVFRLFEKKVILTINEIDNNIFVIFLTFSQYVVITSYFIYALLYF